MELALVVCLVQALLGVLVVGWGPRVLCNVFQGRTGRTRKVVVRCGLWRLLWLVLVPEGLGVIGFALFGRGLHFGPLFLDDASIMLR